MNTSAHPSISMLKSILARLLPALLLAVGLLGAQTPGRAHAAAFVVTDFSDPGASGDSQCSLREAITAANNTAATDCGAASSADDTITFNASAATDITLASNLPQIASASTAGKLAIDGGGLVAVSGANTYLGFYLTTGADLSLNNLTVKNGHSETSTSNYTGGIYNNGGTLNVTGSTIAGNLGQYGGGGIYSCGTLNITGSTISGNSIIGNLNWGAGIYISCGQATITSTTISNNSNGGGTGGGIYNFGTLTVSNSTFSGNSAGGVGGSLNNSTGATANITSSIFTNNHSSGNGGAVANIGTLAVSNTTFTGNSAGTFGRGGALFNYDGTATLVNNTLSGNSAYNGGGIYNYKGLTVKNTLVLGSTRGGNCYWDSPAITSTGNLADDATCGIGFTTSSSIHAGTLGSYGGSTQVIPLLPGSAAIDAGDATACPATDQRGLTRPQGSPCDVGAFETQGFTFTDLTGDSQSAAYNTAFATPLDLKVQANHSGDPVDGGVVTLSAPTSGASLVTTTYNLTIASGAVSQSVTANGAVGAYQVTASTAGAVSVSFHLSNVCTGNGALTVTNADDSGAGSLRQTIADVCPGGTITFDGDYTIPLVSTLAINHSISIDGGAHAVTLDGQDSVRVLAVASGVHLSLDNLTIAHGNAGGGSGGGLNNAGDVTANGVIFSANRTGASAGSGGAISSTGTLTLLDSTFSANQAAQAAGGIDNAGGTLALTSSTFSDNSSGTSGGALRSSGALTASDSTFTSNTAGTSGGGIEIASGTAALTDDTFTGNSATAQGGGVLVAAGTVTLTNSTLSGNSAPTGGGLYASGGVLTLTNDTISGSSGGGLYTAGALTATNTLILGSVSGGDCAGSSLAPASAGNLADDATCGSGFTTSTSIRAGALGSYGGSTQLIPLLPGSAAIDAGVASACPATDQRGVSRPQGSACDIGAFESHGFAFTALTGTPQSTVIDYLFAAPLGLTVIPVRPGDPVDGGVVTLTAPASGASITTTKTTLTIAAGTVSQDVTANHEYGTYRVVASAAGAQDVSFDLTNGCAGATVAVTSAADSDPGSLRQAMKDVCPSGVISFAGDFTIPLESTLVPTFSLTLDGSGHTITLDGQDTVRVLRVTAGLSLTLKDLTITRGYANAGNGAGLYNEGDAAILGSTFTANHTGSNGGLGGAVYSTGALTLTGSSFNANSAGSRSYSSGERGEGGALYSTGAITASELVFTGNHAGVGGGAVFTGGDFTLERGVFSTNTAGDGGAILATGGSLTLAATSLADNVAHFDGGGIYNDGAVLGLTNTTFTGNSASSWGGAIDNASGDAVLTNVTITGNSAASAGGGVNNTGSAFVLYNTILAGNSARNCAGALTDGGNNLDSASTCGFNRARGSLSNTDARLMPLSGSPSYVALKNDSPAIDAVSYNAPNHCPATDQRGLPRDDLACDIGAFELTASDSDTVQLSLSPDRLTTFGPALAGITYQGSDPSPVTVSRGSLSLPVLQSLGLAWELAPTQNTALNLTVSLCYLPSDLGSLPESSLSFYRQVTSMWTSVGTPAFSDSGRYRCATLSGVSAGRYTLATGKTLSIFLPFIGN